MAAEVGSREHIDPITGQRSLQVKGVGAKDSKGRDIGLVAISQETGALALPVQIGNYQYQHAPANAGDVICGTTGAPGDYLHTVTVRSNSGGAILIKDGATTIFTYNVAGAKTLIFDIACTTNWTINTAAGTEALASGDFT
jgi:hypothetical protein